MSIFKTQDEKLFKAVEKRKVQKVRELLATGANANAENKLGMTPLDVCVEQIKDVMGTGGSASGLNNGTCTNIFNANLIWDELVRKDGTLNKYKNDSVYGDGFTLNLTNSAYSKLVFAEPKGSGSNSGPIIIKNA